MNYQEKLFNLLKNNPIPGITSEYQKSFRNAVISELHFELMRRDESLVSDERELTQLKKDYPHYRDNPYNHPSPLSKWYREALQDASRTGIAESEISKRRSTILQKALLRNLQREISALADEMVNELNPPAQTAQPNINPDDPEQGHPPYPGNIPPKPNPPKGPRGRRGGK